MRSLVQIRSQLQDLEPFAREIVDALWRNFSKRILGAGERRRLES